MRQKETLPVIPQAGGDGEKEVSSLRVALLGPPVILWTGQPLAISRRQVRALLYRLASDLQPVPREQLCFLFWPDSPHSCARRSLSHLLTHLRLAFPEPDIVEFSNEYVALDPTRVWCDTVAFDAFFVGRYEARQVAAGDPVDSLAWVERQEEELQYWRGPFLSGFSLPSCPEFESWAGQMRESYTCRYLEALVDLINNYQEHKAYDMAIACANRYLEIDNLAEDIHCKLIELYTAIGNRSAAERQFELCVLTLEKELGVSPSPNTWAIYQSVFGSRLPGALHTACGPIDRLGKIELPFVGRDDVVKQLHQSFNLVCQGRGRLFLISGEPGIGKSRLLQEIAILFRGRATILYSACNPGMGNLPYHAVAEALRAAIEMRPAEIKTGTIWLAEAARLLPEIYSCFSNLPTPLPARPEEARRRLFEALYQLLEGMSGRSRPVLLCLDDLHWADASTLEWLAYLGCRLEVDGSNHILVVGTYRIEAAGCLNELRFGLGRLRILEECLLPRLEADKVLEILDQLFGPGENDLKLAARLHQISGGNPFFLVELLRELAETHGGVCKPADLENLPIPKTIQEAVHQRLACLDARQRKLLEIAAALGRSFTLEMMQMATESGELDVLEGLEVMTTRHLLDERDGHYSFEHELVRMAIYDELGYDRRRFIHRQCGKMLEKLHPQEIALLAWHFEQAGEAQKAAGYAMQAGEKSSKLFAFDEALDYFSRALTLLKLQAASLVEPDDVAENYRQQLRALILRGRVYRSIGDMQAYQNDFEQEAKIAAQVGDETAIAHAILREANAHRWFCRYSQARSCAEKVFNISQELGDLLMEAKALREMGLAARAVGDFDDAQANLDRALRCFHVLGDSSYEVYTICNLSTLYGYLGDFCKAEDLAWTALRCCERAQLLYMRRFAQGVLGVALAGRGQVDQGRECLLSSLELSREIADRAQEIFCLCNLGWLEIRSGRLDDALKYLRDGLVLAERLDSRAEQCQFFAGLAETHRRLGNQRLAKPFALKALELAQRHGRRYDQDQAEQILAGVENSL